MYLEESSCVLGETQTCFEYIDNLMGVPGMLRTSWRRLVKTVLNAPITRPMEPIWKTIAAKLVESI